MHIRGGHHLDGGNAGPGDLLSGGAGVAAGAEAGACAGTGAGAGVDTARSTCSALGKLRCRRSTLGSAQVPVMLNSRVLAAIKGRRRNSCAKKVPKPKAGLMVA
ncbi:MAG: hypothetical protein ACKOB5_03080 [Betaproteobacteria bacterium]